MQIIVDNQERIDKYLIEKLNFSIDKFKISNYNQRCSSNFLTHRLIILCSLYNNTFVRKIQLFFKNN